MAPPQPKNRSHVPAKAGQVRSPPGQPGRRMASRDAGERAAFFARREAATVLRRVLRGDASKRSGGSIKSLVFSPSVRNKRATFALVCQTLKCLPILKEVFASTGVLSSKWKKQEELVYVTAYDILFGQEIAVSGSVEQFILLHKDTFRTTLGKICAKRKVSSIKDLISEKTTVKPKPRFVRVNTLKTTTGSVIEVLSKIHKVEKDDMVPDMLVLPPGTDMHKHPLVTDGKVFLQGKASCMVAVALCPKAGWKSGETDQPLGKLNLKLWNEFGPIECICSRIKLLGFHDFRGDQSELAFLKFFVGSALVLKEVMIVSSFTSKEDAHSKVLPLLSMKWVSAGTKVMVHCSNRQSNIRSFKRASDFSLGDPFVDC